VSKVWFVTGASSGIGAAVAKAALQAGHRVVATARNLEKLRSVLGESGNDRLGLVQLDVSSEAQARLRPVQPARQGLSHGKDRREHRVQQLRFPQRRPSLHAASGGGRAAQRPRASRPRGYICATRRPKASTSFQSVNSMTARGSVGPRVISMMKRIMSRSKKR